VTRLKLFWGKYGYDKDPVTGEKKPNAAHGLCEPAMLPSGQTTCPQCGHEPHVVTSCCNDMPPAVRNFAQVLMDATVDGERLCKLAAINSALANVYIGNSGTSLLGQHFDSPHHFNRPIYSLRLHQPATLAFVTGGIRSAYGVDDKHREDYPIYFQVPLAVNCLTEMDGFAARALMHAVIHDEAVKQPTWSLILRNIHGGLLGTNAQGEDWKEKNTIESLVQVLEDMPM